MTSLVQQGVTKKNQYSKTQKAFMRLKNKIASLQELLAGGKQCLDDGLIFYQTDLLPVQKEFVQGLSAAT